MKKGAHFSEDRVYRYALYRVWDVDLGVLNVIGLNPSTADETTDDNTIRRCIGFARSWGYGSLLMTNIYAWRATRPRDMIEAGLGGKDVVGPDNDEWLRWGVTSCGKTLVAWTGDRRYLVRQRVVYDLLNRIRRDPLYCLGTTKDGSPRHPLYVKGDKQPEVWTPPWIK